MRPFTLFRFLGPLLALLVVASWAHAAEPGAYDITCSQGEDCDRVVVFRSGGLPVNLTGYTHRAQIRTLPTDTVPLAEITIDGSAQAQGRITLRLPASLTAQLAGKAAAWDLKQTSPSGQVSYPLRGKFKCYWSVTK